MKALIFGIRGQDGVYLSQLLLNKGYKVFSTSRNTKANNLNN
jgi:GDPmannose 4,6-dehydratase